MDLDRFITETLRRQLLVENAINNSWRAARKMVVDSFGYTKEEAENTLNEICILVGLSYEMVKFIKGCTRMFLNGELKDPQVINDFKDALNKIKTDGHIGQFDSDLRRLDQPAGTVNSAKDIISIFKPEIDRERAEQRQKLSGMEFVPNTDYEIVKINSFKEARKYYRYTSWCVTKDEIHYKSYITNGINQFYFCLQNGFENIEDDGDFNDKQDTYALSMLAILVNPEGELIHCTNRKNNDQGVLNPMEISKLIGRNFYETFKPNTRWRDALEDAKNKLANGKNPERIFKEVRAINNGLFLVRLLERWNILNRSSFMNEYWYDFVDNFYEGFARVKDEAKGWDFINSDGKEICGRWYDYVYDFSEGFARVWDKNKGWNFINHEGKELLGRWYDFVGDFQNGFARVWDKTKGYNFINREGKEICDRLYESAWDIKDGFAKVYNKGNGFNFINSDGKEVCDRWYDFADDFSEGFAEVYDKNNGCNFINSEGKEICDRWYGSVNNFHEGFANVYEKGKGWNYINREGKEICDSWYDGVRDFFEGFARVEDKTKGYNFINRDGKEISDRWYIYAWDFHNGFAKVKDNNKGWNFINREGREIGDRWYNDVCDFSKGFALVKYKHIHYWLRKKDFVLCDYKKKKPIEDTPTQMAESIINRLVRGVVVEGRNDSEKRSKKTYTMKELGKKTNKRKHYVTESDTEFVSNDNVANEISYEDAYNNAVRLIKAGYLVHGTWKKFDVFERGLIQGGSRAKEGYGFYFTDMIYKCCEYGYNFKVIKKDHFNFINSHDDLTDYDFIVNKQDGHEEIFEIITQTRKTYPYVKTIGNLEYYIPLLDIPKLINLYLDFGYDGYETDGIFTVFNIEKLNREVKDGNYVLNNVLNENINEIDKNDISLKSFKPTKDLNRDFWDDDDLLKSKIRLKLLDIADDFIDTLNITWMKPEDIYFTGSLANYNWSKYSDIDIHIVYDYSKIYSRNEFVEDYFKSKKHLWNNDHDKLNILGFDVEMGVEDINKPLESTGVYSLNKAKWIVKPGRFKNIKLDKNYVLTEIEKITENVDFLISRFRRTVDKHKREKITKKLTSLFRKVKEKRKLGLKKGGEYDEDNIIFKYLRRAGYLDKISNTIKRGYDDVNSIEK